tara:strand:- start:42 stop:242 length:201 start_codon:yes stop_codon:yes gene_type:complete
LQVNYLNKKPNHMSKLAKVKQVLTSEYFVAGVAGVTGAVVFFKGLPLIGGIAIGVAATKLWGVLRK